MGVENLAQFLVSNKNNKNDQSDFLYGLVTSTSPLKIKIENNLELTSSFLILTSAVKEKKVRCTCRDGGSEIEIVKKLEVGERVILIKGNEGQRYIVLDRG